MKNNKKFFDLLNEAIAKRNDYGVDTKNKLQPLLKFGDEQDPDPLNNDYTYHGDYSRITREIKKERRDLYKKENLSGKVSSRTQKNKELMELEEIQQTPLLFGQKEKIERVKLSTLQHDLIELSKEIENIKSTNTKYKTRLSEVLTKFFQVPGAKLAKRYLILPLNNNVTVNDINKLNLNRDQAPDAIYSMMKNKEVFVDHALDDELKKYLIDCGYGFKTENDLYMNICYTMTGAKVKIIDELNKIKKIDIANKKKFIAKATDPMKKQGAELEVKKRESYSDAFLDRMSIINSESIKDIKMEEMNVIVITWLPRMIMSQSTTTLWTSCMKLPTHDDHTGGSNRHFIPGSIENGAFIAWLVNIKDTKTIQKPIARILIKPFESFKRKFNEEKKIIWWPSRLYFDGSEINDIKVFQMCITNFCYRKQYKQIKALGNTIIEPEKGQYLDNDQAELGNLNLKSMINNIVSNNKTTTNIFTAFDYSNKKAIFYLSQLKPEQLNRDLAFFMLMSLRNNNLTLFEYLAKINKEATHDSVQSYFDNIGSIVTRDKEKTQSRMVIYLLKYYVNFLSKETIRYFITVIFGSQFYSEIKDYLINEKQMLLSFFNDNEDDENCHFLRTNFLSNKMQLPYLQLIFDLVNKNNLADKFINKTNIHTLVSVFYAIDSFTDLDKKFIEVYNSFYLNIQNAISNNKELKNAFVKKYMDLTVDYNVLSAKNSDINEIKKARIDSYLGIVKNEKIKINKLNQVLISSLDSKSEINIELFNKFSEAGLLSFEFLLIDNEVYGVVNLLLKLDIDNYKKLLFEYEKKNNNVTKMYQLLTLMIASMNTVSGTNFDEKIKYYIETYGDYFKEEMRKHGVINEYISKRKDILKDNNIFNMMLKMFNINLDQTTLIRFLSPNVNADLFDNKNFINNLDHLMSLSKIKKIELYYDEDKTIGMKHLITNLFNYDFKERDDKNFKYVLKYLDFEKLIDMFDEKKSFKDIPINYSYFILNTDLIHIIFKNGKLRKNDELMNKLYSNLLIDVDKENFKYIFGNNPIEIITKVISRNNSATYAVMTAEKIIKIYDINGDDFAKSKIFKEILNTIGKDKYFSGFKNLFNLIDKKFTFDNFNKYFVKDLVDNNDNKFHYYFMLKELLSSEIGKDEKQKIFDNFDRYLYNVKVENVTKENSVNALINLTAALDLLSNLKDVKLYKYEEMKKVFTYINELIFEIAKHKKQMMHGFEFLTVKYYNAIHNCLKLATKDDLKIYLMYLVDDRRINNLVFIKD